MHALIVSMTFQLLLEFKKHFVRLSLLLESKYVFVFSSFGETYHEEIPLLSKTRVFLLNISWFGMSVMFLILSVEGKEESTIYNLLFANWKGARKFS